MARIQFPALVPSRRSFKPGTKAITTFTSQNGATTFIEFGNRFVGASMDLEFRNIPDDDANAIFLHYESLGEDDSITFTRESGLYGIDQNLYISMNKGNGPIRFRYKEPPTIESVYPGISTVRCSFVGYLFGAEEIE